MHAEHTVFQHLASLIAERMGGERGPARNRCALDDDHHNGCGSVIPLSFTGHLMSKYNLEIAGGLGPTVGKV